MVWIERDASYADPLTVRKVSYGEVGQQLDMIYRDLKAGKALNAADAEWYTHVTTVKENTVRPSDVEEPMDPTMDEDEVAEFMSDAAEPATTRPMKLSSETVPCWERYSNWGGSYTEGFE